MAAAAEAAGFHGFGFTDHPAPTQRWLEAGGHDALDPFVAMGFAAALTTTLRLIPNIVVLPYRNPFVVAKAGATLDMLSGGRFTLAVGVGYLKGEFAALGVDHDERNELFDEALDVIRRDLDRRRRHLRGPALQRPRHHRPPATGEQAASADLDRRQHAAARQRVADRTATAGARSPRRPSLPRPRAPRRMDSGSPGRGHRRPAPPLRRRGPGLRRVSTSRSPTPTAATREATTSTPTPTSTGLEALAALGVTWVQVGLPGDSLAHALEAIERFGKSVIAQTG